jgi:hypothetical protein
MFIPPTRVSFKIIHTSLIAYPGLNLVLIPKKISVNFNILISFQGLSDNIIQHPLRTVRHFSELMNYTTWSKSSHILLQPVSRLKVDAKYLLYTCTCVYASISFMGCWLALIKIFITKLKKSSSRVYGIFKL